VINAAPDDPKPLIPPPSDRPTDPLGLRAMLGESLYTLLVKQGELENGMSWLLDREREVRTRIYELDVSVAGLKEHMTRLVDFFNAVQARRAAVQGDVQKVIQAALHQWVADGGAADGMGELELLLLHAMGDVLEAREARIDTQAAIIRDQAGELHRLTTLTDQLATELGGEAVATELLRMREQIATLTTQLESTRQANADMWAMHTRQVTNLARALTPEPPPE
jgi:hypothetical protein